MNSGGWRERNVNVDVRVKGLTTEFTEGHREKR